jgi:predicted Na+-dependent transporter
MTKSTQWVRKTHRWLAIAFTVTVVAASIAVAQEEPVLWVTYLPLFPLAVLLFTGLTMFFQPYARKWRRRREATL